mmetsp:Transcript_1044/g.1310  ORF Transcript_1044/g.1310 Transcript_1044/m.1310 type:complete len:341 (+) Transcript_1044:195-1217(+)|eukprot:CAMPEP_0194154204 /NCGR_PEP_ID=MMETSP0152-20130528/59687_1 /TAXON_ID=1049557 /ORGANISM="Thalassiothrix antarctica, Strain L6-D1" /LENGTH=340 /DNA_ID=CAMNT_0038860109 /DNA_START=199 /DNA_END=1221 /DNA_ORIENTATION=+
MTASLSPSRLSPSSDDNDYKENDKIYVTPEPYDVLGGRCGTAFRHPGNQMLRNTIASLLEEYKSHQKSRKEKSKIIQHLISSIKRKGGRFLKYDINEQKWYIAGYNLARLKVAYAFRDASMPNKVKCMDAILTKSEEQRQQGEETKEQSKPLLNIYNSKSNDNLFWEENDSPLPYSKQPESPSSYDDDKTSDAWHYQEDKQIDLGGFPVQRPQCAASQTNNQDHFPVGQHYHQQQFHYHRHNRNYNHYEDEPSYPSYARYGHYSTRQQTIPPSTQNAFSGAISQKHKAMISPHHLASQQEKRSDLFEPLPLDYPPQIQDDNIFLPFIMKEDLAHHLSLPK